ncbi:MAG: hypothetical protein A3J51_05880 [Omnitrophica WOR_2 bacterium RIFCSPHIGHO2_02_FULL_45_21]|nr:MAG: hypothetical protein A3J51_05880 [Omnitrophica WOR_2 bacterium RIFCSPHIGHO2_02_FULL_45_21]
MARILKVGIERKEGFTYFIDNEGDVACAGASGEIKKVAKTGIKRKEGWVYYIDKEGNISVEISTKISFELFINKEEYDKAMEGYIKATNLEEIEEEAEEELEDYTILKVNTLIDWLEPNKDLQVYFGNDSVGTLFYSDCDIGFDGEKIIIYPRREEKRWPLKDAIDIDDFSRSKSDETGLLKAMKVSTLIKCLEPYKDLQVFFGGDEAGDNIYSYCDVEDREEVVKIYPFGGEDVDGEGCGVEKLKVNWKNGKNFWRQLVPYYKNLETQTQENVYFWGLLLCELKHFRSRDDVIDGEEDYAREFSQFILDEINKDSPKEDKKILTALIKKIEILIQFTTFEDFKQFILAGRFLNKKKNKVENLLMRVLGGQSIFSIYFSPIQKEINNFEKSLSPEEREVLIKKERIMLREFLIKETQNSLVILRRIRTEEDKERIEEERCKKENIFRKLKEEESQKLRMERLRQKARQEVLEEEFKEIPENERVRFISEDVKELVWRRDQGKCVKCGSKEKLEFDHIIPFSKGGSDTARNIQLLCEKCNRSKHDSI